MAYVDAARKDGRPTWFVFRGETDDGVTVTPVVWATRTLAETGMVEARLKVESGIVRSVPQTVGGAPAASSVTLGLENGDGAERELIIGSTSADPRDEYSEGSILNLSGKLYHAVQDDDGTIYESAMTPTLHVSGSPTYDGHVLHLPMSSSDDKILGRSKYAWTLADVKASQNGTDGVDPVSGVEIDADYVESDATTGTLTQDEITSALRSWQEGLDAPARFVYGGGQPVQLLRVQTMQGGGKDKTSRAVTFFAFLTILETGISNFSRWGFSVDQVAGLDTPAMVGGHRIIKAPRWLRDTEGDWKLVWVVFVTQDFADGKKVPGDLLYQDQQFWLTGMPSSQGLATHNPPPPKSEFGTPAYVIRRLVTDHSELGSGGIDTTSFEAARKAIPFSDLCSGFYNGDTELRDICSHVASAFGLTLWVGTDDKLRAKVTGTFSRAELDLIDAGGLDELTRSDVLGDWQEIIPTTAGQRGAAISRVSVDWVDHQIRFYGSDYLQRGYRAAVRVPLGQSVEARISGAWVTPHRGFNVLAAYASRFAYPARRIRFRTRLWITARELGTLMYLTHFRGLESVAGGYARRLVRLEGWEVAPDLRNCVATFEDLGPVAGLRFALLDDYDEWVKTTPTAGWTLTLSAGSPNVVASNNIFVGGDVGTTLVLRGSDVDGNRRNRKIDIVTDPTHATMDYPASANEVITAAGAGIDATWLIAYNHGVPPPGDRELAYIQEGRESDAEFLDATECFRYEVA